MQEETQSKPNRERVIHAAWQIFAQFGYQKASMQDIAQAAGVSKAVLFKYFGTKERLYEQAFREASRAILLADATALEGNEVGTSVFSILRKTVASRMRLFAKSPHVYAFSYAAAYDQSPVAQRLAQEEILRARARESDKSAYNCLREDISPEQAKQMLFWISQGFLNDKIANGMEHSDRLEQEYLEWIDLLERLMTSGKGGADGANANETGKR